VRPILLVEDGIYYFDTLRWTLRHAGYNVDCVSGGQEALDYLSVAQAVGLVILHCRRPDRELLSRLKQPGSPVVVVAGGGPTTPEADFYLRTPVSEKQLFAVVFAYHQVAPRGVASPPRADEPVPPRPTSS
jgi:DNA-binding response OmpR family regulator